VRAAAARRAVVVAALIVSGVPAAASAVPVAKAANNRYSATVLRRSVRVSWTTQAGPRAFRARSLVMRRDGVVVARLSTRARQFDDAAVRVGETHTYALSLLGTQRHRRAEVTAFSLSVRVPAYLAGAANRDITPTGVVNVGGNGLGDGRLLPDAVVSRGGMAAAKNERIRSRAFVIDDGRQAIAIASIETQGMFAAYENGPFGLVDMAARVAARNPRLPANHILIAADHTHSGPDTLGAWGGVPNAYLQLVADRTVEAVEQAYRDREFADIRVGSSDASDLIYNQSCSEALNQSKDAVYPGPDLCGTPGKDGALRVVQAVAPSRGPVVTMVGFAAHATAGGASGLHGDWPQFISDAMAARYGGFGQAMEGAVGSVQPCRPACAFTRPANPGYTVADRKTAIVRNYMAHVDDALAHARAVTGPVGAAQAFIREPVVGVPVLALFVGGGLVGAHLMRAHEPPWAVGATVRTVTAALRVGGVLFAGYPGEGYHAIGEGIRAAVSGEQEVIPLGLANDQLGYLISPARYFPLIAAEVAVNDNVLFNVSPTIGDHVMCSDIALAAAIGFAVTAPPDCVPYAAIDAIGDPVAGVPVGAPAI
jgi:hypothetical protein